MLRISFDRWRRLAIKKTKSHRPVKLIYSSDPHPLNAQDGIFYLFFEDTQYLTVRIGKQMEFDIVVTSHSSTGLELEKKKQNFTQGLSHLDVDLEGMLGVITHGQFHTLPQSSKQSSIVGGKRHPVIVTWASSRLRLAALCLEKVCFLIQAHLWMQFRTCEYLWMPLDTIDGRVSLIVHGETAPCQYLGQRTQEIRR